MSLNTLLQKCITLNSDTFNVFFDVSFDKVRVSVIAGQWLPNKSPVLWKTADINDCDAIQRIIDKLERCNAEFES